MIATINPATNETLRTFEPATDARIEQTLATAAAAFARHRETSFESRAAKLRSAAAILDTDNDRLARLATLEMGKPLAAARAEVAKCALACRYYADHGAAHLADEIVATSASRSLIRYQPLGVILAVMPWNFPYWQVFRFAATALIAGNVGILKHASNVPQCALAIEDVLRRAGFDGGEFQTLLIGSEAVARILEDPRIAAATLTGSEPAGASVASIAGRMIKKTVLELGGSDPFIVMPSADLDAAVASAVRARCQNNGQSCIAAKRFIVHRDIAAPFLERFVAGMKALVVGDPMLDATEIGPLATRQIVSEIEAQVADTLVKGGRLLTGGHRIEGKGNFYAPTVMTDIPENAALDHEETFGPVAAVFVVAGAGEAIARANDTIFGLGASAWTRDEREIELFGEGIEAGQVFINAMVASDPRVPFGGIKRSGFGRELGVAGIREFVNTKTIWIA